MGIEASQDELALFKGAIWHPMFVELLLSTLLEKVDD